MRGKYVELVEKTLNEVIISSTSEIRRKLTMFVRKYFTDMSFLMIPEADDTDENITTYDINMFLKYELIKREPRRIILTPKGVALLLNISVDSNAKGNCFTNDQLGDFAREYFKADERKLKDYRERLIYATSKGIKIKKL